MCNIFGRNVVIYVYTFQQPKIRSSSAPPPKAMRINCLLLLVVLCALGFTASAQSSYSRLELKANRFFDQREWAQAAATYYQMLEQRPDVAATYGRAIVSNAVRNDTLAEMSLMAKALDNKIPFDSVLSRVRSESFAIGKSNLYGDFLLRVKDAYPWMRRPIDNYLLRYYTFRHDGKKMMEISQMMLQGSPDNIQFLSTYADGAMLCGDYSKGVETYRRILAIAPDDYDTLLTLGNYYRLQGDTATAAPLLKRAYALHPTPHLQQILTPSHR